MSYHETSFDWTDAAVAALKELHFGGDSYSTIAAELVTRFGGALTKNAAVSKAHRIGLQKRRDHNPNVSLRHKPRKPAIRRSGQGYIPLKPADVVEIAPEPAKPPAPDFLGIPFLNLKPNHCRYPRGGDDGNPITFCGQKRMPDSAYCAACHQRCHNGFGRVE